MPDLPKEEWLAGLEKDLQNREGHANEYFWHMVHAWRARDPDSLRKAVELIKEHDIGAYWRIRDELVDLLNLVKP